MSIERLRKAVAPQSAPAALEPLRADDAAPWILTSEADNTFLGISPIAYAGAGAVFVVTLLVFILGTI